MIEEWSNRKSRRSDHFTTQFFTSAKLINEKSGRKLRSGRGALPSAAARRAENVPFSGEYDSSEITACDYDYFPLPSAAWPR